MLDGFQAGLSWSIILKNATLSAKPSRTSIRKRSRASPRLTSHDSCRTPASSAHVPKSRRLSAVRAPISRWQKTGEDFSDFVWNFVGGKPIQNSGNVPTKTPLSEEISKALKKRGFKFVGPVIVYAWMQAVGVVNDHSSACFRRKMVSANKKSRRK